MEDWFLYHKIYNAPCQKDVLPYLFYCVFSKIGYSSYFSHIHAETRDDLLQDMEIRNLPHILHEGALYKSCMQQQQARHEGLLKLIP